MAGTYTQRRDLLPVGALPSCQRYSLVGVIVGDWTGYVNADQVTTSFRSGKGESLASESELSNTNEYFNTLLKTKDVTYDTGHAFETVKRQAVMSFPTDRNNTKYNSWVGPFVATPMWNVKLSDYPAIPKWANASSDGNKAIVNTYPTQPMVGLSQTVAELKREGLPSLFGSQIASMKGSASRAIGGEVLNSLFGWTPLIADLDKLLKAVVSSSKVIQQMQRDSGKLVRRKYHFPTETTLVSSTSTRMLNHTLVSSANPVSAKWGTLITEETIEIKRWFSGAYTYFIDPGDDLVGKAKMYEQLASKLLGTRLTPDVLWNLAPWSWLADWYANIGDNITVASAFQQDGLVLKYGYVMRKVTARRMYTFTPDPHPTVKMQTSHLILTSTSKERQKSSPIGFGISNDAHTERQWAIYGSLGLTKAPRSLR